MKEGNRKTPLSKFQIILSTDNFVEKIYLWKQKLMGEALRRSEI
jgi:hypothetical protein